MCCVKLDGKGSVPVRQSFFSGLGFVGGGGSRGERRLGERSGLLLGGGCC